MNQGIKSFNFEDFYSQLKKIVYANDKEALRVFLNQHLKALDEALLIELRSVLFSFLTNDPFPLPEDDFKVIAKEFGIEQYVIDHCIKLAHELFNPDSVEYQKRMGTRRLLTTMKAPYSVVKNIVKASVPLRQRIWQTDLTKILKKTSSIVPNYVQLKQVSF